MKYAEVYTSIKTLEVNHPFDYIVPAELLSLIRPGSMVTVPFGSRQEIGFVTRIKDSTEIAFKDLKPVADIISKVPVFNDYTLRLIYWMSAYYLQPFGKIIEFFLPPGKKIKILNLFKNPGGSRSDLSVLLKKGFIEEKKRRSIDYFEYNPDHGKPGHIQKENPLLPKENKTFLQRINKFISKNIFGSFVMYDFKKTDRIQLFGFLCREALDNNKKVLILTPEISDAAELFNNLNSKCLQGKLIIYHSGLRQSEQLAKWYDIYTGNIDVVIGNRSAVFLPFKDIGLIIIDEEHDPSYKESTIVRYNAGDIALRIGKILKIPVVFASNTPSSKLWYRVENSRDFERVRPGTSFFKNNSVVKEVLDLKAVDNFKEDINITNMLHKAINSEIAAGNKALVFFNKRGYSSFLICRDCGSIPVCPKCNISYSYHSSSGSLVCHHCSYSEDFRERCGICGSENIVFRGTGIEKIESKLRKRFNGVPILRVDSDLVKNKKADTDVRLALERDGPMIVIGTQKAVASFSFKDLTIAAIINYDSLFQLPDFQVNEKVFQLLVQILGKIKDSDKSRFLIQAYNTGNEVLGCFLSSEGYGDFYKKELKRRKDLYYPPFSNLINIIVSGKNNETVKKDVKNLAGAISSISKIKFFLLGPSPAPFSKINVNYRWHILIKTDSVIRFNNNIRAIFKDFKKDEDNKIVFDVDPVWIL